MKRGNKMAELYFVNEQHEKNFEKTLEKWPKAKNDSEYKSSCYILSVPSIYEKVEALIPDFEYPTDWIWRWEYAYNSKLRESLGVTKEIDVDYDLTGAMVELGRLALNLWNSYEHFNLMDCISSLDAKNYKVFQYAIAIRMRKIAVEI